MNYKKIIKSQQLRFKILHLLSWVPDSIMLRLQYRIKMGFWPNFKQPKRYTEKLQLYKMKCRYPVMAQCVDKFEVRKYVESKGLGHILNVIYGVYDSVDEIDFNSLPEKFVVKSTTGGGGLNVIVVRDKSQCDFEDIKCEIATWNKHKRGSISAGREWAYENMENSRIIIEKYLENEDGLDDYKFLCFNGKMKYLWVDKGRYDSHKRSFWDEKLNYLDVNYGYPQIGSSTDLPANINDMISVAEMLSSDFPHARIDLYNINKIIVFGEITFYCSSGYRKFTPDSFDFELGSYFTEY